MTIIYIQLSEMMFFLAVKWGYEHYNHRGRILIYDPLSLTNPDHLKTNLNFEPVRELFVLLVLSFKNVISFEKQLVCALVIQYFIAFSYELLSPLLDKNLKT